MQHKNVSSSDIQSVGYDAASSTLEIKFHSGGLYEYFDVPESMWRALMDAISHGKYFHAHIKERYRFHKMR